MNKSANNKTRSFFMGFTPFNHSHDASHLKDVYEMLPEVGDIVLHHFDAGIPWEEIYEGKPWPEKLEKDLQTRLELQSKDMKIVLAVTPLSPLRDELAGAWASTQDKKRAGVWESKGFDDPDIIQTYIEFCREMIRQFKPEFFIYGIEVNILGHKNAAEWDKFVQLCNETYTTLKREYLLLPISLSIQLGDYYSNIAIDNAHLPKIMPFTDYIAVSWYPFNLFSGSEEPYKLPEGAFADIRKFAPDKPFAIAETGFIAKDLILVGEYAMHLEGRESWQDTFTRLLFEQCNREDARFVCWFISRDYDELWEVMSKKGAPEWMKVWMNTGIVTASGMRRKAFNTWRKWRALDNIGVKNQSVK